MRIVVCLCLFVVNAASAAPPPGHPSPMEASQILGVSSKPDIALPNAGVVEQAIDSNQYTYVGLRSENGTKWLAVTRMQLAAGDKVRYGEGARMTNFYSKALKRTFPEILFVGQMVRDEK